MIKYKKDVLSSNIYYIAGSNLFNSISKKLAYTAGWTVGAQLMVGNDNSMKFTIPVLLTTSTLSLLLRRRVINGKKEYNNALNRLENVTKELILLGYDLDNNAFDESIIYTDGLILFKDKEENEYKLYEQLEDDDVKYYLLYKNDIEDSMSDVNSHEDVTYQIKRGLLKKKF